MSESWSRKGYQGCILLGLELLCEVLRLQFMVAQELYAVIKEEDTY